MSSSPRRDPIGAERADVMSLHISPGMALAAETCVCMYVCMYVCMCELIGTDAMSLRMSPSTARAAQNCVCMYV